MDSTFQRQRQARCLLLVKQTLQILSYRAGITVSTFSSSILREGGSAGLIRSP